MFFGTRTLNHKIIPFFISYIRRVRDHPLPIWAGFAIIGYIQFRHIRRRPIDESFDGTLISMYRLLPLRMLSRTWGAINNVNLPVPFRSPLLGLYASVFGINLHEAQEPDLKKYENLGTLFRRRLKADARPIDKSASIVSPSDGKVMHFGPIETDTDFIEQVKGVNYSLPTFLGVHEFKNLKHNRVPSRLYQCVLYLAPGDYHCFHSPVDFRVQERRHIYGNLLSVNPKISRWFEGLLHTNERVIYTGSWIHGFFSLTAVGATNVGTIKVTFDPELSTNAIQTKSKSQKLVKFNGTERNVYCDKGSFFGEFNMGSTIVLIFEAPVDFEFKLVPYQAVKQGQNISNLI